MKQRRVSQAPYPLLIALALVLAARCWADRPSESHWTTVDHKKVYYLSAGPVDGQPVLLLHGGRFKADTWKKTKTIDRLAQKGYAVVAVDLPGFGESPRSTLPPGKWLGQLLEVLKLERPVIVSPSMSGRFSLPFVTSNPDRVAGFVAVAPVGIAQHQSKLSNITVPILAIWGENDTVIPQAHADLLVTRAPDARKVVVPDAGHALYMDKPDAFHRELLQFLDKLNATGKSANTSKTPSSESRP